MTLLVLLLTGCTELPEFVTITGAVFDGRGEDAAPVAGATVKVHDAGLALVDEGLTDAAGAFSLDARPAQAIFLELSGPGFVATGFSGTLGLADVAFPEGLLWMEAEADIDALRALFAGCPGLDAGGGGGMVEGEVRFYAPGYEPDPGSEWPLNEDAWVRAYDSAGEAVDACYLNADGTAYDGEATLTGPSGRFAVLGGPSGPVTLEVGYEASGEPYYQAFYTIYVPEGGVAPFWPLYTNLPGM